MSNESNNEIPFIGNIFDQPRQLTSDEPEGVWDFAAITSKGRFKDLQNKLIDEIHESTVIIEFRDDPDEPIRRHEPLTLFVDSDFPCTLLRMCTPQFCHKLDKSHAELFRGLTKDNLESGIVERISALNQSAPMTAIPIQKPEFVSDGEGYLKYDCPITGYRETVFPIFFGDKMLGVLLVGRIRFTDGIEKETACRDHFVNNFDEYSDTWIDKNEQSSISGIKEGFDDIKSLFLAGNSRDDKNLFLKDEDDYKAKIVKKSQTALKKFHDELIDVLNDKRKEFVLTVGSRLMNEFGEPKQMEIKINEEDPSKIDKDALSTFWSNVEIMLKRLSNYLNISNIKIFGPGQVNITREADYEQAILNVRASLKDDQSQLSIVLPEKKQYHTRNNNLLSMIQPENSVSEDSVFLFFPVKTNRHYSMAVLLAPDSPEKKSSGSDNVFLKQREMLSEGLTSLFLLVYTRLLVLLNNLSNTQMDITWQIYRHEVINNIRGLSDVKVKSHFNIDKLNTELSKLSMEVAPKHLRKKIEDLKNGILLHLSNKNKDLSDIIVLLSKLTENARVVNGFLTKFSPETFYIIRGILLKWKHIFSKDMSAQYQYLRIYLNDIEDEQAGDISVRTDKSFLDQIVYNLVNNAHKYACSGSNIHVSFDKFEGQSLGELNVVNYGIGITTNQEEPYRLFYRGVNDKEYEDGTGIGLYVSQQIATKRLQSRIWHTCEPVSSYYVPFMEPYLERDFPDEPMEKKEEIEAELQDIKHKGLYDKIVSGKTGLFGMEFDDQKIKDKISDPTYEVKFTMIVKDFGRR